jgi:hypothetical protein
MTNCQDFKKGQTYKCGDCGLEIKIMKECIECDPKGDTCCVEGCSFKCCGSEMTLARVK